MIIVALVAGLGGLFAVWWELRQIRRGIPASPDWWERWFNPPKPRKRVL